MTLLTFVFVVVTLWALSVGLKRWRRSYIGRNHLIDRVMIMLEQIVFGFPSERKVYRWLAGLVVRGIQGPRLTPEQMLEKIKQQKKGGSLD